MDNAALQWTAFFVLVLPMSMASWVFGIMSAGFLRDRADQPLLFRVISGRMPTPSGRAPLRSGVFFAAVGVAFFNCIPLVILIRNPYGLQTLAVDLVYLLVQGIWLATVSRAIIRSRSPE